MSQKVMEQRPLCMMEVLRNLGVGHMFRKIADVWHDCGTLDTMQHAFQRDKGVEGALKVDSAVSEDAFLYRKEYFECSLDISKAFDKVERTIGKEMGLRRMGVSEKVIACIKALDCGALLFVKTGHGLSDPFAPETGWPQGSEEGPIGWNAHYDWMLQLQLEAADRDPYLITDCSLTDPSKSTPCSGTWQCICDWAKKLTRPVIAVIGAVFADDAKWWARTARGLRVAIDISEDFLGFHGGQFNPDKSSTACIGWVTGDDPEARHWKELPFSFEVEMVEPDADGNARWVVLQRKTGHAAERYLGLQGTCTVWWGAAERMAAEGIKANSANCSRAGVKHHGARMLLMGVTAPQANHQLKHTSSSDDALLDIWRPAEIAWKKATGMAITTESHMHKSVAGGFADGTRVEQVMMLMQMVGRDDMVGDIARNEAARLHLMIGTAEHPLSTRWQECIGWRGDWIGRLWMWLSSQDMSILGRDSMQAACVHDSSLMAMNMTDSERGLVSIACFQREVYMVSDLVMPDGTSLRSELLPRGTWTAANAACATLSAVLMRELMTPDAKLRTPLQGKRSGNCWLRRGRTVGGINGDGDLVIGSVLASWRGFTVISGWEAMSEVTGSRWSMRTACGLAPMGFADCWREHFATDRRDIVASGTCFPVDVTEGLRSDDWQHWRVGDATSWLNAWVQHAKDCVVSRAGTGTSAHAVGMAEVIPAGDTVGAATCEAGTVGMRGTAAIGAWTDCSTPARIKMQPTELVPCSTVEFTSDGSVEDAACEAAKGAYGWVARDASQCGGWGDFTVMLAGAGTVKGEWWEHTSSRAEAAGLLDAMRAALVLARRDDTLRSAIFSLDNEAVVKQCATLMAWSALRWLKCSDRDLWRCLAYEMKALAGAGVLTAVRWIRSHPEGRLAHTAWSRDDVANHMADRWASKAHSLPCADEGHIVAGAWDLAHCGKAITGPLRRSVKAILMTRHFQAGLLKSGRATADCDMDWTLVSRGLAAAKKEGLAALVWWTKLLANVLATESVLAKRGHGIPVDGDASTCKLCGVAVENSWHMIAECTGCPKVVACREKMVRRVHAALSKHLAADTDAMLALKEMWKVDGEGKLRSWLAADDVDAAYTGALNCNEDDELADHHARMCSLRQVMLQQTGLESAALGCMTKGWRRLVRMECDMRPGDALQLLTDVQVAMRLGIRDVWLCRNDARQKRLRALKQTIWHRRDAALTKLLERYRRRGEAAPDGTRRHVLNLKGKHLRRWLARQERDQRCVTEFFEHKPLTEELKERRKQRHRRITAMALGRQPCRSKTQTSLAGSLVAHSGDDTGVLSFSRHVPAHTLPLAAPKAADNALPTAARRRSTQLRLALTNQGLSAVTPAPVFTGNKRRRGGAAAGCGNVLAKQRKQSCTATALRTRPRAEMAPDLPAGVVAATLKRKHGMAKHGKVLPRLATQVGQKRKSASGFKPAHGTQLAHCSSSKSACVAQASGSLQEGGKNAVELLFNTATRPLD